MPWAAALEDIFHIGGRWPIFSKLQKLFCFLFNFGHTCYNTKSIYLRILIEFRQIITLKGRNEIISKCRHRPKILNGRCFESSNFLKISSRNFD